MKVALKLPAQPTGDRIPPPFLSVALDRPEHCVLAT